MDGIDDGAGVLQLEAGSHTIPANSNQALKILAMFPVCSAANVQAFS